MSIYIFAGAERNIEATLEFCVASGSYGQRNQKTKIIF